MIFISRLEQWLPSRHAVAITMRFKREIVPREDDLRKAALKRGYEIAGGSITIGCTDGIQEWRFVAVALHKGSGARLSELSAELSAFSGIDGYQLSHARN
jgi:putative Mg2+ transporter-C (MgtC) family protein